MQVKKNTGSVVLMVRPLKFGFNPQTESSNAFQKKTSLSTSEEISQMARQEFDTLHHTLLTHKIEVVVFDEDLSQITPDAVFPNNWISFHEGNNIVIYPMLASNRRVEKRNDIVHFFTSQSKFGFNNIIDLSYFENENKFLEGTGSIVFDYINKVAYANLSPRTHQDVLFFLCKKLGYSPVTFHSTDKKGKDIYHANVIMCITDDIAIICIDSIKNNEEKTTIVDSLKNSGHTIISITFEQVEQFAGNMYGLENSDGKKFLLMSTSAYNSLTPEQINNIQKFRTIIHSAIPTIEKHGGGSVRCMIADIRK